MTKLTISPDLALPEEFATEGVAVIGKRGSGKSNTEARFAEVLFDAGIPFAVVDPKGDWHGIRSSADGKKPGLPVPVFGGLHGDFPLDPRTGARIADLLVDEMLSAVLDVSHLSKTGELPEFLVAFCKQLMHRHQLEPHVRTVILEEAHRYIPQQVTSKTSVLKEAAAALLLEGRAFGLGCWAATQRPARLHKDVLEEVGTAIIHAIGVSATNDKRTIKGWVEHHELGGEIVDSLTALQPGEAWVLMPQDGLVRRVRIDRRATFDSAATPKVGQAPRRPSTMADIDQGAIKEALADVVERAKAEDPKELRKRIRDLERQLAERPVETTTVEVEREVVPAALHDDLVDARRILSEGAARYEDAAAGLRALVDRIADPERWKPTAPVPPAPAVARASTRTAPAPAPRRDIPARTSSADVTPAEGLTGPQQRVLDSIAWWNAVGFPQPSKLQVGFIAGYRVGKKVGGTYGNVLGELRSAGLIDYPSAGAVILTDAGVAVAGEADIEPTTEGLQAAVFARLDGPERRVLQVVIDAYPDAVSKQDVGAAAGYTVGAKVGGTFGNILGRLRSLGLIEYPRHGFVVASPVLFLEGGSA